MQVARLERPHPQSAGTTKSQRWGGTRKRPKKTITSDREVTYCQKEINTFLTKTFFPPRRFFHARLFFVPREHCWGGNNYMGKNMGCQFVW